MLASMVSANLVVLERKAVFVVRCNGGVIGAGLAVARQRTILNWQERWKTDTQTIG